MGDVSDGRLVLRSALFRRAPEIPTMEINIARARVDRGWEPSAALSMYNIYMCVCFCMCECVCVWKMQEGQHLRVCLKWSAVSCSRVECSLCGMRWGRSGRWGFMYVSNWCVRHSPGRRQLCSAVKVGWGLLCCRLSSVSVMAPSAALEDLKHYSGSGTPEE